MKTDPARSAIMRAVRSKNTSPEIALRRILHTIAPGYRLHRKDIFGHPDVAYVGKKLAIFMHGCFWHGHDCARGARMPKTNVEYWRKKIARNVERDSEHRLALRKAGWRALVVWECELREAAKVERKLRRFVCAPARPSPARGRRWPAGRMRAP